MIPASAPAPAPDPPRRPALAFFLSLIVPGLGHLYAGRALRALVAMPVLILVTGVAAMTLAFGLPRPVNVVAMFAVGLAVPLLFARDAARAAAGAPRQWYSRWWAYALFVVAVGVLQEQVATRVRADWVEAFRIPAGSMAPALLPGDHVFVDKRAFRTHAPRRGDVVVYRLPKDPGKIMVHRVVGLPGETVELRAGTLLVDGVATPEPYASYDPRAKDPRDTAPAVQVPTNGYLLLGDDRTRAYDGRVSGPIAGSEILGAVRLVWWSSVPDGGVVRWDRIGLHVE